MEVKAPQDAACVDCPYREDAPSGLWAESEYLKLPAYDRPVGEGQPMAYFLCHEQNSSLCAGWVGCHGAENLLGVRVAVATGELRDDELAATMAYKPDPRVPLFESAEEAAAHGLRDIDHPDDRTRQRADKVMQKPTPITPRTLGR